MHRGVVLALLAAALFVTAGRVRLGAETGWHHVRAVPARNVDYRLVIDPPSFAYVDAGAPGTGPGLQLELRSPATGQIVKVLGTLGQSFTNSGLAISPNGRSVYLTFFGPGTIRIVRIAVADRRRTFVVDGEQPALSPNGRLLAYAAGKAHPRFRYRVFPSARLGVHDLTTGRTRTIDLRGLLGRSGDLVNSAITWLANGSDIAVLPREAPPAVPLAGSRPKGQPARTGTPSCSTFPASPTCLIVAHLAPTGRLTARGINLAGVTWPVMIAGDGLAPNSLLLADNTAHGTIVDRVALSTRGGAVTPLVSLPPAALPVTFDLAGTQLLYLVPQSLVSPPALWIARIAPGQLLSPHELIASARLQAVAW